LIHHVLEQQQWRSEKKQVQNRKSEGQWHDWMMVRSGKGMRMMDKRMAGC